MFSSILRLCRFSSLRAASRPFFLNLTLPVVTSTISLSPIYALYTPMLRLDPSFSDKTILSSAPTAPNVDCFCIHGVEIKVCSFGGFIDYHAGVDCEDRKWNNITWYENKRCLPWIEPEGGWRAFHEPDDSPRSIETRAPLRPVSMALL